MQPSKFSTYELHDEAESTAQLLIKNATSKFKFLTALEGFMAFKSSELTQVPQRSRVIIVPACDYYPLKAATCR